MLLFKKIPDELDAFDGDLVISVIGQDERPLLSTNAWIDWRLFGTLTDLIARGLFVGQMGEKCLLPTYAKFHFDRLVLLGGGPLFTEASDPLTEDGRQRWLQISRLLAETMSSLRVQRVGLSLPRYESGEHERALLRTLQSSPLPHDLHLFVSRAANLPARSLAV